MFYKGGDDDNNPPVVNPNAGADVVGLEGGDHKGEGDPGKPVVDDSQLG